MTVNDNNKVVERPSKLQDHSALFQNVPYVEANSSIFRRETEWVRKKNQVQKLF